LSLFFSFHFQFEYILLYNLNKTFKFKSRILFNSGKEQRAEL
jgi:hypothetical protein